ncbi:MAG: hypothetical protein OXU68_04040 [Bacteroidota bacterium]|nr:hypothetical protein [Bacteroidota bacterium]MDE2956166.1 hypothetical protein [Bacteroidota bacterium]
MDSRLINGHLYEESAMITSTFPKPFFVLFTGCTKRFRCWFSELLTVVHFRKSSDLTYAISRSIKLGIAEMPLVNMVPL